MQFKRVFLYTKFCIRDTFVL